MDELYGSEVKAAHYSADRQGHLIGLQAVRIRPGHNHFMGSIPSKDMSDLYFQWETDQ